MQIIKTKAYKTILLENKFPISGCASMNCKTRVFSEILRTMMTTVALKVGCCQKSFHLNFIRWMNSRKSVTVLSVQMDCDASYLSCLVDEKYIRNLFEIKILLQQKKLRKEVTSLSLLNNWSAFNLFAHNVFVMKINK